MGRAELGQAPSAPDHALTRAGALELIPRSRMGIHLNQDVLTSTQTEECYYHSRLHRTTSKIYKTNYEKIMCKSFTSFFNGPNVSWYIGKD